MKHHQQNLNLFINRRPPFVQALPERVSSQLLMVCRSEERLLSDPNWEILSTQQTWPGMG